MKRTKLRRTRWSTRNVGKVVAAEERRPAPADLDVRDIATPSLGPYEATYDVSHGYAHDRSIICP